MAFLDTRCGPSQTITKNGLCFSVTVIVRKQLSFESPWHNETYLHKLGGRLRVDTMTDFNLVRCLAKLDNILVTSHFLEFLVTEKVTLWSIL